MKVKVLRYKKSKEFIRLKKFDGEPMVFTSELPKIQPESATLEIIKSIIETDDFYEGIDLDFNEIELVGFDLIETGEVGADIRNKLSPYKNLVALVELFLKEREHGKKIALKKLIRKEIIRSKKSIKYLAGLL